VRRALGILAALTLAAHLVSLPPTLEDLDSVNFALGVRDFDVSRHQPHPPGYPVFIALGKLGTSALAAVGVNQPAVRGLAVWSALGAAAIVLLAFAFFSALDANVTRSAVASVLLAVSPLFWFTSVRPLSDMPGLAAAFAALAALAAGIRSSDLTPLVAGAFLAGVSVGFRSQMAALTLPMLAFALWSRMSLFSSSENRDLTPRRFLIVLAAAAAGVAVWGVPLIVASGGLTGYLHALGSQADEDLTGVVMLWTHRSARVAAFAVLHTFVLPWDSPILAGVVLMLAVSGLLVLARREPRVLVMLAVTFGPYALFHLLFQETITVRYALPLVAPVTYLAAVVVAQADVRAASIALVAIAAFSLSCAAPATAAFGRSPSPIFGLLSDASLLRERGAEPVVAMHRRVATESRRARIWAGELPGKVLPAPRDYEWLELTRAWREGYDGETWFIADPRRTDLALIDREHTRVRQYRWPFDGAVYVGGARPDQLDWHVFHRPGWFLEQGWALTPEVAGISDRDGWGPNRRPSVGWVRRRDGGAVMMLGGRHLGGAGDPPVRIVATFDERSMATFDVKPGFFLEFVDLPPGTLAGDSRFARLNVRADATAGGAVPPVAIEQFNLQAPDGVQFGFGEGWHEPEYNPTTARSWRWMSERAIVRVHSPGRGVVLRIVCDSPLRYFDDSPLFRVSVGDRVLSELRPGDDFTVEVSVPGDLLTAADGRIVLTSDRAYVAGEKEGTADRRRLALRIYSLSVEGR
jgi:hypothetical protein